MRVAPCATQELVGLGSTSAGTKVAAYQGVWADFRAESPWKLLFLPSVFGLPVSEPLQT